MESMVAGGCNNDDVVKRGGGKNAAGCDNAENRGNTAGTRTECGRPNAGGGPNFKSW